MSFLNQDRFSRTKGKNKDIVLHAGIRHPINGSLTEELRRYWNDQIHDMSVVRHPVGSIGFFQDLEEYRFDKQHYLPELVDFSAYKEKKLLELGCGVGIDLARFARHGAHVTGIDLSERAIELARRNFELHCLKGNFQVMNGEKLDFDEDAFDVVYVHGVLPYTGNVERMIGEIHRVLRPGGEAILQVYNRISWLNILSKFMKVRLEHQEAPAFHKHTAAEFRKMLSRFAKTQFIFERFPVKTRLQTGLKGSLYNAFFVGTFNAIPRAVVRRFGWHIIAKTVK